MTLHNEFMRRGRVEEPAAEKATCVFINAPAWNLTPDNYQPWEFLRNVHPENTFVYSLAPQWAKERYPYRPEPKATPTDPAPVI